MTPTRAIVLSAGLGTRMRPLTNTLPKPLIPVKGKPLIDWCLDWLEQVGITDVVVNTSYLAQQLEDHLRHRASPVIYFSREEPAPLETGGGIAKALPFLGDAPFVAMNSDAILPPTKMHPIATLAAAWDDSLDFLMLVVPKNKAYGWEGKGDFILNEKGEIRRAKEGEEAPYIFTGVEIIHPRVFADNPGGAFSLNYYWKKLARADGFHDRMRAVIHEGDWLNVGDLAGLKTAEAY